MGPDIRLLWVFLKYLIMPNVDTQDDLVLDYEEDDIPRLELRKHRYGGDEYVKKNVEESVEENKKD